LGNAKLKKKANSNIERVPHAVAVARRIANLAVGLLPSNFPAPQLEGLNGDSLRQQFMQLQQLVTLETLLAYSWSIGVPVIRIDDLPPGGRIDGVALTAGGRPVIVLCTGKKQPAFSLYHLAHEMGHVAAGHLKRGESIDVSIDDGDSDPDEQEADSFARRLVYGTDKPVFWSLHRIKGEAIALNARHSASQLGLDVGATATCYGHTMAQRGIPSWPAVNRALQLLELASGAHEAIKFQMKRHLNLDDLGEEDRRLFGSVTGLEGQD
jgi:hypothetical protein